MRNVTLYSDGACEGNPGPGGWAAILTYQEHAKEISGGSPATTNNRMELQAAVEGLRALKESCQVEFFTDSKYVQSGISEWLKDWKLRGWRTRDKKPVKNEELWRALDVESAKHKVSWKWLKGHAGHAMNERCDLLARTEILRIRQQFKPEQLKALLEEFKRSLDPAELNGKLEGFG
ncbi:MAG: ribonuclease HI [Limisphaerales bacterium]